MSAGHSRILAYLAWIRAAVVGGTTIFKTFAAPETAYACPGTQMPAEEMPPRANVTPDVEVSEGACMNCTLAEKGGRAERSGTALW